MRYYAYREIQNSELTLFLCLDYVIITYRIVYTSYGVSCASVNMYVFFNGKIINFHQPTIIIHLIFLEFFKEEINLHLKFRKICRKCKQFISVTFRISFNNMCCVDRRSGLKCISYRKLYHTFHIYRSHRYLNMQLI